MEGGTSAAMPNHRGALEYFNREQLSFIQRHGNWLWLAVFATGGISSAAAWLAQRARWRRREHVDAALDRLSAVLRGARGARSFAELESLVSEVDRMVATALVDARRPSTTTRVMSALVLAAKEARSAIDDRRRELRDMGAPSALR
jgi:hypothetical protein